MNSENINDLIGQGITLMSVENYAAAKEIFEKVTQMDPKSQEAYEHLGNAYANLEEYDDALSAFKNKLLLDPDSGETLFAVGNIYLLMDERLKAIEYYNKAEEAGFNNALLYQTLASVFYEVNDVQQALRNISRAIAIAPLDGELRLLKVRIYLAENRYEEALETLDELQKILPDAFEAYDLKAQILCALGRYEETLKISELGCTRFPEDANLSMTKLKVLVEMEKDEEAFNLTNLMIENGQTEKVMKEFSMQLSILYLRKNNMQEALKILNNANEKLKGDADTVYLILDLYGKTEDYANVIKTSEKLVEMNPGIFYDSTAKYFHANALEKMGRIDEAKKEYKKLTSLLRKVTIDNPSFYEGYIYRLLSHVGLEEYDKALSLADYLENLYPDRTDSHMFKYFIYNKQGYSDKAELEKQKALSINPNCQL